LREITEQVVDSYWLHAHVFGYASGRCQSLPRFTYLELLVDSSSTVKDTLRLKPIDDECWTVKGSRFFVEYPEKPVDFPVE
jgi:hypothetical protein